MVSFRMKRCGTSSKKPPTTVYTSKMKDNIFHQFFRTVKAVLIQWRKGMGNRVKQARIGQGFWGENLTGMPDIEYFGLIFPEIGEQDGGQGHNE